MQHSTRRRFLQQSGTSLAATATMTAAAARRVLGANDRIRVGLIGGGGRGRYDARLFAARKDTEVVWVADPHEDRLSQAAKELGGSVQTAADFRRILDDESVDAVINATPVHWHAPGTIVACEAGKHVYVEKPCSHNIREGRLIIGAARRNNCVVQHGTQVRSTSTIAEGVRLLREGIIGHVLVARAWNIQRRPGHGRGKPIDPPANLNYDLWLGPVPEMPYLDDSFSRWNWIREFGTGEIGNDGVHDIDYARWGLGVETHPTFISAIGGRYMYPNGAEFPDTQQVSYEYDAAGTPGGKRVLIYEQRLWSTNYPHNCDSGVEFYGDKGQMFLTRRGKIEVLLDRNEQQPVDVPLEPQNTESHVADFINCIRDRRQSNANASIAHHTTSLCHLGNIATRVARSLRFDPDRERFVDDDEANALLTREYRKDHWAAQ